jgi:hypothetical protein
MADYGKLLSRIWSDPEFTSLDARAQQLYCLLISYATRNYAGVLPLTLKRWAKSTRDATVDNITDALKALTAAKFVAVDWDTEELLIRTYIRNDEVYRQPNLMISARRSALQVESPALRWVLHDELLRLPDHKDPHKTEETANDLVRGLQRTLPEGFGEGFHEGIGEPPGVGGYLSNQQEHLHLHRTPAPAAVPIAEPDDAISATPGADLVRRIIPKEHPAATRTALRHRASELINSGTPKPVVEAALQLWLTKPNLGPNALPSLVSEVIKSRDNPTGGPTGRPHKMRALAELAREVEAQEQAQLTQKELTP